MVNRAVTIGEMEGAVPLGELEMAITTILGLAVEVVLEGEGGLEVEAVMEMIVEALELVVLAAVVEAGVALEEVEASVGFLVPVQYSNMFS